MGKSAKTYADWFTREQMAVYNFYYSELEELVKTMFVWKNLPLGCTQRYLENTLFESGCAVVFKDSDGVVKCAKAEPIGLNAYGEPLGFKPIALNGLTFGIPVVTEENCVPIYNNYFHKGSCSDIIFFAKKISNIEKTVDMNLEQLKNPFIIGCADGQVKTVELMLSKKCEGQPYILGANDVMNNLDIKLFNLEVKNNTGDLQDTKHEYKNEALTFFGINNVNVIKKERLITGEANQNNEEIALHRNSRYRTRNDACLAIKEKFGIDISVDISPDLLYNVNRFIGEDKSKGSDGNE